jgi:aryl-alcohol dehydrogenase-like predicted oxidoreductase
MAQRRLGQTDLFLAPLVFGGNVFGWTADKATSFRLLDGFVAGGLNAIDTADVYSAWVPGNKGGESEAIIGEWLKASGKRNDVIIITKVGFPLAPGREGLRAPYIERAVEESLKRLGVETIDLYLAHKFDPETPHEETLGAFDKLKKAGKIRWSGASNYDATQLGASLEVAKAKGLPRYEVLQPEYNLYDRGSFEGPLADLTTEAGLGVIVYFSLAKGFLSGKYRSEADFGKSPRGGRIGDYLNPRGFRILAALDAVSARNGAKPAEVALAWLMQRPSVTAPIASATSLEQLASLVAAVKLTLTSEDVAELDAASAP